MALVGPNVPPAYFSVSLHTLQQPWDVPRHGGGVLVTALILGERTAISPVPNGREVRHFISVTSLLDVDSHKGRSLPCAASSLSPPPLIILNAQRLLPLDFLPPISIALLFSVLSSSVRPFDRTSFAFARCLLVQWLSWL